MSEDIVPDRQALAMLTDNQRLLLAVERLFQLAMEETPADIASLADLLDAITASEVVVSNVALALPASRLLFGSAGVTIDTSLASLVRIFVNVATALGYTPADVTEPFVTSAASAALTNERVLSGGAGVTIDTATAGLIKVLVNVVTALGYTPANAAGQTFGGDIAAPNVIAAGYVQTGVTTYAGLPSAASVPGARYIITDCNTSVFAANAAGGGGSTMPVYASPGGVWIVG